MLPSFIGAGSDVQTGSGSKFVRLEEGKPVELIPLTGVEPIDGEEPSGSNCVISYRQYTYWLDNKKDGEFSPSFPALGTPDDPGALLGLESKFRGLMIVAQSGSEGELVWAFGVSIFKQLVDIEAALGTSIKGHILKVTKKGTGMNTRYSVINTGRTVEIEGDPETDLMEHVGPTTRTEIIQALEKVKAWPPEGGDPFAEKVALGKKLGAGVAKPKAKVEEPAEDEEEVPAKPAKKSKPAPEPVVEEDDDDGDWEDDSEETEFEVPAAPTKKTKALAK